MPNAPILPPRSERLRSGARKAEALARQVHEATGGILMASSSPDCPEWAASRILELEAKFEKNTADSCAHNPQVVNDDVVFAPMWKPGFVTCEECPHLADMKPGRDLRCDKCGRDCTVEPFWLAIIVHNAIISMFGVCEDCAPPSSAPVEVSE